MELSGGGLKTENVCALDAQYNFQKDKGNSPDSRLVVSFKGEESFTSLSVILTSDESREFEKVLQQDRDVAETNFLTALYPPKMTVCDNKDILSFRNFQ